MCVFSPGNLANTSAGAGYVGLGTLSAYLTCMRDGCCDACRPMFSSEIFSAGFLGVSGPCRDLCCDACCDASTLRIPCPCQRGSATRLECWEFGDLAAIAAATMAATMFRCDWWRPCPCFSGLATPCWGSWRALLRLSTSCPRLLCWVGQSREHSAPDDVRGCFTCLEHAKFAGDGGFGAAYSLP